MIYPSKELVAIFKDALDLNQNLERIGTEDHGLMTSSVKQDLANSGCVAYRDEIQAAIKLFFSLL